MHVVLIGGSVAGLTCALFLEKQGHRCTVLERDRDPLPDSPVAAFASWHRPGVPQLRHSHAFLARLRNVLRERLPGFYDRLLGAGAEEIGVADLFAPTIDDPSPQPGDDALVMLACRRATFEWALRAEALSRPGIALRGGARVVAFDVAPGPPSLGRTRINGVRLAGEAPLHADLVVDASGRHSRAARWLDRLGLPSPTSERAPSGIFYCSRFYRGHPTRNAERREFAIAADLGFLKYAVFHGDAGIFSVTLAASPADDALGGLRTRSGFETAASSLPQVTRFVEGAEPVSRVHTMAGLDNERRVPGADAVSGLVSLGDAAMHTNPLYGRGCTMAVLHASLLADATSAHGAGLEMEADVAQQTERELLPWYRFACSQDRDAIDQAAAYRDGSAHEQTRSDGTLDPKAYMRSLVRLGVLPAMRTDARVARRGFRSFHMLDAPGSMMQDAEVMKRILARFRENEAGPHNAAPLSREKFVAGLSAAE